MKISLEGTEAQKRAANHPPGVSDPVISHWLREWSFWDALRVIGKSVLDGLQAELKRLEPIPDEANLETAVDFEVWLDDIRDKPRKNRGFKTMFKVCVLPQADLHEEIEGKKRDQAKKKRDL